MAKRSHPAMPQVALPGIIGGLGPLAHIEFERRLIEWGVRSGARRDQDHPVWIVVNATDTPDRTQSLNGDVEDCTPWLVRYGHHLETAGANFLIVTCNSAHGFYSNVQKQLSIPWLHLMDCTTQSIQTKWPTTEKIGILATDGTLRMGLYNRSLSRVGLTPIYPDIDSTIQKQIMKAIYAPAWGIKSSGMWVSESALYAIEGAMRWLKHQGAELVIIGCTELSIAIAKLKSAPLPWIDPLDVAASLTLDLAYGHRQLPSILAA
ncbi:MAG: amino acid racemase [Leptolyngbyaceae bacterium]|nr:amino acid racemase [Leptolyngbyaceae bacterium]